MKITRARVVYGESIASICSIWALFFWLPAKVTTKNMQLCTFGNIRLVHYDEKLIEYKYQELSRYFYSSYRRKQ